MHNKVDTLRSVLTPLSLLLVLLGMGLMFQHQYTNAQDEGFSGNVDDPLRTGIQDLSGEILETKDNLRQQLEGSLGTTIRETLDVDSEFSDEEKVERALNNIAGILNPDQVQGTSLEIISNQLSILSVLEISNFISQAAINSSQNSEYFNDEGRDYKDELQALNSKIKEGVDLHIDALEILDESGTFLPKLAIK